MMNKGCHISHTTHESIDNPISFQASAIRKGQSGEQIGGSVLPWMGSATAGYLDHISAANLTYASYRALLLR